MKQVNLLILILVGLLPLGVKSADWNSCADDLEQFRNAIRDSFDMANRVKTMQADLENCKKYPDVFDLARDGCAGKADSYQGLIHNLEDEFKNVDSHIRAVNSSCGVAIAMVGLSENRNQKSPPNKNMCDLYKGDKDILPIKSLMKMCVQSMSEAECHKCLDN